LWDNDGDYSAVIDQLKQANSGSSKTAQQQIFLYTKGDAAKCLRLIKRRRRQVTIESVSSRLHRYNAKSGRQGEIKSFLSLGLDLARSGWDISLNTYIPNYIQGATLNPQRLYKFVWTAFSGEYAVHEDLVSQNACETLLKDIKRNGYILPVRFSVTVPGQRVKEFTFHNLYKNSHYNTEFAVMLFRFLSNVRSHFKNRYKDYYYKSSRAKKKPTSPYLINIIENVELRQQEQNILLTV
jgi:hypothetical protein